MAGLTIGCEEPTAMSDITDSAARTHGPHYLLLMLARAIMNGLVVGLLVATLPASAGAIDDDDPVTECTHVTCDASRTRAHLRHVNDSRQLVVGVVRHGGQRHSGETVHLQVSFGFGWATIDKAITGGPHRRALFLVGPTSTGHEPTYRLRYFGDVDTWPSDSAPFTG